MKINLSEQSMDIVMHIVRKKGVKLKDSIEFIINNPEEIEITRGEIYEKEAEMPYKKGYKK
ncbi:hypothetical protein MYOV056v2_p0042 [Vibrio phage 184E37.3a]|nr:hypothetical protein MYOV056v2_p0042 [Vibrio phage 184E37.3a]QZI90013.1 hypothetical protein MYOV057v1_p0098 [Vibrio phage 184E37.1]